MKKLIYLTLPLMVACTDNATKKEGTSLDTESNTVAPPVEKEIKIERADDTSTNPITSIRQAVNTINTSTLKKKTYRFICDEKMIVDYYSKEGDIVKISVDFGTVGDSYAREDYYYDKGELIFFYEFVEGGPACEGCSTRHEYRSYISNGKVIRYLKDNKEESCRKCSFDTNSRQYKLLKATTTEQVKALFCP